MSPRTISRNDHVDPGDRPQRDTDGGGAPRDPRVALGAASGRDQARTRSPHADRRDLEVGRDRGRDIVAGEQPAHDDRVEDHHADDERQPPAPFLLSRRRSAVHRLRSRP
jgi:hypothetical protein